jgi:hypothetical protein
VRVFSHVPHLRQESGIEQVVCKCTGHRMLRPIQKEAVLTERVESTESLYKRHLLQAVKVISMALECMFPQTGEQQRGMLRRRSHLLLRELVSDAECGSQSFRAVVLLHDYAHASPRQYAQQRLTAPLVREAH